MSDEANRCDLHGVYRDKHARTAILRAFITARGEFEVTVAVGFESQRPDVTLVLVEIDGTRAMFEPADLIAFARAISSSVDVAETIGARWQDAEGLRELAAILLRNAEQAAALAPRRLH